MRFLDMLRDMFAPKVLDAESIQRASLLRSIFMQGELGGLEMQDWRVEAEHRILRERIH